MVQSSDYSREAGGAALAARLRRLSERIDRDGSRIYAAQDIRFEQRWYGLLNQLVLNGPMSIGDIAQALRITHVSVSQASRSLEAAGIITSAASPNDARRRQLTLTAKGNALVARAFTALAGFQCRGRRAQCRGRRRRSSARPPRRRAGAQIAFRPYRRETGIALQDAGAD